MRSCPRGELQRVQLIAAVASLAEQLEEPGVPGLSNRAVAGRNEQNRASYCFQPTPLGSRVPTDTEVEIIGVDRFTLRVRPVATETRT